MKRHTSKTDVLEELRTRLDVIILLLLDHETGTTLSATRRIRRLLDCGLSKADVARILSKPTNYVTALSSADRTGEKRSR
jgi:hypothetical protein